MVTRSEVHFLPPPRPQEPWKEFLSHQEKHSSDFHQASPHGFLQLMASNPPLGNLSVLRSHVNTSEAYLPHGLLMGVITRKFQPSFHKRRDLTEGCCCSVWVRDLSDQVRVTFWEGAVQEHYSKLQEGRLLVIKGFKVRPIYQPEQQQGPDWDRLSPAEVSITGSSVPRAGIRISQVETIDLHTLWQFRPTDGNMKAFLRGFFNFEFSPTTLSSLSLSPLTSEARRSVVARVVYKSSERTTRGKLGEVPALWLALFDGSLEGDAGREYIWLFLVFNFQPRLLERIKANQLIVVTCVSPVYLFHESWHLVPGHTLILLSTYCSQVYILEDEQDSSAWHYVRAVYKQKVRSLEARAEALALRFCDCAPEVSRAAPNHTLFRQGNFECRVPSHTAS